MYNKIIYGPSSITLQERKKVLISFIIPMVLFGGLSVIPLQKYYGWEHEDWTGAAEFLKINSQAGDVIVVEPQTNIKSLLFYYDANLKKTTIISTNGYILFLTHAD